MEWDDRLTVTAFSTCSFDTCLAESLSSLCTQSVSRVVIICLDNPYYPLLSVPISVFVFSLSACDRSRWHYSQAEGGWWAIALIAHVWSHLHRQTHFIWRYLSEQEPSYIIPRLLLLHQTEDLVSCLSV